MEVTTPNESTVGYLKQDLDFEDGRTVQQEIGEAFSVIKKLESDIESINVEISQRQDYESEEYMQLLTALNDLNERFGMLGGYTIQSEMSQVLLGQRLCGVQRWMANLELAKILLNGRRIATR